jgi:hypothetical protein
MKQLIKVAMLLILVGYVGLGIHYLVSRQHKIDLREVELKSTTTNLKQLQLRYDTLNSKLDDELHKNTMDEQKLQELESEKQQIDKERQELRQQVQAKLDAKRQEEERQNIAARSLVDAVTGTATAYAAGSGGIDCNNQSDAKAFLYCHESGNNPAAVNPGGCRGLGQACPGSKLPCSSADYNCQDVWFTNYMSGRYGTWEAAKSFWQAQCGTPQGCWW